MRLTITRAVAGLSGEAIQFASVSRRPVECVFACGGESRGGRGSRIRGKVGSTFSPNTCGLPRLSTNVSGAFRPDSVTPNA